MTFENSYASLPQDFFEAVAPTPVREPRLLRLNRELASQLGLSPEELATPEGVAMLAGNRVPEGAEPLAMAYAGHQFGSWVPRLGDGRAVLLGEVVDRDGVRRDVQLKGAGPTPFSRNGDGRAALGPVLREYVVSEAMAGLGIPTTRALAMVTTGEPVYRERALPGAVLTRVAASHVRVGTFQYFLGLGRGDAVRVLADYVIARLYPQVAEAAHPYRALLDGVIARQAELVARWLLVGFVHGVMNTDNTSISGETLDYGPCAFLDAYDPGQVYSSIDRGGRYAYHQQPAIAHWNLARFAETLLPLLADDEEVAVASARDALDAFGPAFERHYHAGLRRKLGLQDAPTGDAELAGELLQRLAEQQVDFTNAFRGLAEAVTDDAAPLRQLFGDPAPFDAWSSGWRERLRAEGRDTAEVARDLRAANPAYIPRNHRVQQAIDAAEAGDLGLLDDLLAVVTRPYDDHPERAAFARPPRPDEAVTRTFCGT